VTPLDLGLESRLPRVPSVTHDIPAHEQSLQYYLQPITQFTSTGYSLGNELS